MPHEPAPATNRTGCKPSGCKRSGCEVSGRSGHRTAALAVVVAAMFPALAACGGSEGPTAISAAAGTVVDSTLDTSVGSQLGDAVDTAGGPGNGTNPSTTPGTTATASTAAATTLATDPVTVAPTTTPAIPTTPPPAAPTDAPAAIDSATPTAYDLSGDRVTVGRSVEGREIVAERFGTVGGRRILIIGVIHGNEAAGTAIIDALRSKPVPDGNELWLIESMNPDGQAIGDRQNARQVDLNRNFPYDWAPLGQPGDGQYAGSGPASEPETQAMVAFITELQPDIAIWYHQDLDVIAPAKGRDGEIRSRYAELTGMQIADAPFNYSGARYTGIAATWARRTLAPIGAVPFIVELGETLSPEQAEAHANAILTIAAEM